MQLSDQQPTSEDGRERRRFNLERRIGAGAYGEVYLAELETSAGFRRRVAIKVLHEETCRNRSVANRMRDEGRILGRLAHPNIIDVLDLVQLGSQWAIVMSYIPGADLEQVLQALNMVDRSVPPRAAVEMGACIGRALDAVWSTPGGDGKPMRVVHRDIKPSNVRVSPQGALKVLDFGVARTNSADREARTRGPCMIGTERYMAPECITLEGEGPESDVYALGATVAELFLGEPIGRTPVREPAHKEFVAKAMTRVYDAIEAPHAIRKRLVGLLEVSLDGDRAARPTAAEMAREFESLATLLPGDGLTVFCRDFVPQVAELIEIPVTEEVSGVLVESSLRPDTITDDPPSPPAPAPLSGLRQNLTIALSMGLGAFFGCAGVVMIIESVREQERPPVVSVALAEAAEPAPSVEPVVAAPAHDTDVPAGDTDVVEADADVEPAEDDGITMLQAATPTPRPRATPRRVVSSTPKPEPTATPAPTPAPAVSVVDKGTLSVPGATDTVVRCGHVNSRGAATVKLRKVPQGRCTVTATIKGAQHESTVNITDGRKRRCVLKKDQFRCE